MSSRQPDPTWPWFLDRKPLFIDYGPQHQYYWRPSDATIQAAVFCLSCRQDEKGCFRRHPRRSTSCLWSLAVQGHRDLQSHGRVLTEEGLRQHIEWAWFFAWPLLKEQFQSPKPVPMPKVDWLTLAQSQPKLHTEPSH